MRRVFLHRRDPGNFNARMIELHAKHLSPLGVKLMFDDSLGSEIIDLMTTEYHELGLLAWWPDIIGERLLTLPRRGWINLHPSYLPFNRGKHPNFWCLAEGTPCGASLHFATSLIDAGDIVARAELPINWEDTGETVYKRSLELILQLFDANIDKILKDQIQRIPQAPAEGTFHRAIEIDVGSQVDLDRNYRARDLLNLIRARMFRPHPSAFFLDGGKKYSVEVIIRETKTIKDE